MRYFLLFIFLLLSSLHMTTAQGRIDIAGGMTMPMMDFGSHDVTNTGASFANGQSVGTLRYTLYGRVSQGMKFVESIIQCPQFNPKSETQRLHIFAQYQLHTFQLDQSIDDYVWSALAPSMVSASIQNQRVTRINSTWVEHALGLGMKYYIPLSQRIYLYPVVSLGLSYLSYPSFSFSFDEVQPITTRTYTFEHTTENVLGGHGNLGLGIELAFKGWGMFLESSLHAFQNIPSTTIHIQGSDGSTSTLTRDRFALFSSHVQLGIFFDWGKH